MLDGSTKEIEELANTNPSGETKDDRKKAWEEIRNKINKKANLLDINLYETWKNQPDVNKSLNFRNPFEKPKERWDERYTMISEYLAKLNEGHEKLNKAGAKATKAAIDAVGNEVIDWALKRGPSGVIIKALGYDAADVGNKIKEARNIDEVLKRLRDEIGMVKEAAEEASDILKDLNALFDKFNKLIDRSISPNNKTYSDRYRSQEKDIFGKKGKDSPPKPPKPEPAKTSGKPLTEEPEPAGTATPSTPAPGENWTVSDTVALAVEEYIRRFEGNTCFGQVVKLGDPAIYHAAARNQLTIQDGVIGNLVTGKRAQGSHSDGTWATNGWIYLPWRVKTIGDDRKKQQTLWHEMTHHIEWLTGRKQSGNDRNTGYMDEVSNAFNGWRKHELDVKEGRQTPEGARAIWKHLLQNLRDLEGGSAAGGQPPDDDLAQFTGFRARVDDVIALYRSDACGDALKDLANFDEAFQERLEKGAKIVTAKPSFVLSRLGNPGELELQFTDNKLKKELEDGTLTLSWKSTPEGTFRQIGDSLKTRFTALKPGTVKITAVVETRGPQKKNGTVQLDVPVTVPNDFLSLTLEPKKLKVGEKGKATIDIEFDWNSRFIYTWRGENCEIENVDRLSTTFTATNPGTATVSVELQIDDADGNRISLITKSAMFIVDESPGGDDKKAPAPDDKNDGQLPPPQVQPGSYTQPSGQAGVDPGVSGEIGVAPGPSGQPGATGQAESGSKGQTAVTGQTEAGVKGQAGVTGEPETGIPGKTDTGAKGEAGVTSGESGQIGISSGPPACSYQYSEWGECSRADKKQTRTVISKEPQGCEEKAKPVLEQGCTPPPTEQEKRNTYLNCLCRCYGNWASNIGVWYDPEEKIKPECKSSGPCIGGIGSWGCTVRHSFGAPNDCAKSCYEGAYGKSSYDEKTADKIRRDENKKFAEPLKLKLNDGKCPITAQLGDIINLKASVEGGIPPHKFTWSDNGQAKENAFTFANTREPGPHSISVTVTDDEGNAAAATCSVVVDAVTVQIIKTSPQENVLPIGSHASFKAIVKSGPNQVSGELKFQWQPHPEVQFGDEKKPLFETTAPNTEVTYTKIGTFPMSVNVLKKVGGAFTTVGESNQLPIEIIIPKLKLTINKSQPNIGENVVITVHEEPKMDDKAISFWWEYSGNAENPGPAANIPNSRAYSFKPKDANPITVTVHAKTKDGKDDLGDEKATITAKSYNVTVTGPKAAGPKPQIWKCDTQLGGACPGLVEVDKEIAVHQRIEFSADISPKPETDLRYNWTVSGGSCTLSNPISRDVGVTCSETGSYQMTVTARDKENIELGKGTGNLAVTISQDQLNTAAAKAKPKVTVTADKTVLTIGESVGASATVDGGKTPYNYKWTGDYEGQGQSVRFSPKKSGDHTLSVEVTDAAGNKGSANTTFKVEALKVTIEGLRDEVVYGTKLSLSVTPEGHHIIWKSEPAITFTPQQSVGGKTSASFNSIGKVKIWAVAQQKIGGEVIGESDKKEINVTAPKFEITFDPPKGKVGDEVTATIKTTPPIDKSLLKYVWESPKRSDIRPYDANRVRFTPKHIRPVEFVALAKDPVKHQTLAEIKGTYTAEAVKLDVTLTADKPRLKVGETTAIRADVKGGKTPYIFAWKGDHAGSGPSVRFSAQKSGQQSLSVEVTDVFGNKGAADTSLIVEQPATRGVEQPATRDSAQKAPATTVGPLTSLPTSTTRDRAPEEYDSTKDPNFTRPGTPSKRPLDITAVDTFSSEFQQNQPGQSKTKTEQTPQNVMPQPESYMADPAKKPEGPDSTPQSLSSPYPPGFPPLRPGITQQSPGSYPPSPPPDSGQSQVRTSWDKLIPPPSERGAKSPDKRWGSGTSTSSPPPHPATTLPKPPAPPPQPPPPSGTYVMAEITNRSKQNAHIFPEGEIFGQGNRFEPGGKKKVRVKVPSNNKITFHAGRNGQIIASQSWYYDPAHPDSIPVVIFDESNPYGKLVIMKGLR